VRRHTFTINTMMVVMLVVVVVMMMMMMLMMVMVLMMMMMMMMMVNHHLAHSVPRQQPAFLTNMHVELVAADHQTLQQQSAGTSISPRYTPQCQSQ
jgi:hypothetical protein